jgi:hypothetical protein
MHVKAMRAAKREAGLQGRGPMSVSNLQIADTFNALGDLLEMVEANPFRCAPIVPSHGDRTTPLTTGDKGPAYG